MKERPFCWCPDRQIVDFFDEYLRHFYRMVDPKQMVVMN